MTLRSLDGQPVTDATFMLGSGIQRTTTVAEVLGQAVSAPAVLGIDSTVPIGVVPLSASGSGRAFVIESLEREAGS